MGVELNPNPRNSIVSIKSTSPQEQSPTVLNEITNSQQPISVAALHQASRPSEEALRNILAKLRESVDKYNGWRMFRDLRCIDTSAQLKFFLDNPKDYTTMLRFLKDINESHGGSDPLSQRCFALLREMHEQMAIFFSRLWVQRRGFLKNKNIDMRAFENKTYDALLLEQEKKALNLLRILGGTCYAKNTDTKPFPETRRELNSHWEVIFRSMDREKWDNSESNLIAEITPYKVDKGALVLKPETAEQLTKKTKLDHSLLVAA